MVVTDIRMPPDNSDEGIQVANRLRADEPRDRRRRPQPVRRARVRARALAEGAERRGYLLKDRVSDAGEIPAAIREVARGGSVVDSKVVEALVGARTARSSPLDELTPRERETLEQMAQGKTTPRSRPRS